MLQEFNYKQLCGEKEENLLKENGMSHISSYIIKSIVKLSSEIVITVSTFFFLFLVN